MTGNSKRDIKNLCTRLLREQKRRADKERKLPFHKKLEILDQLMTDGVPKVGRVVDSEQ
jgi:hypothetical protein